MRTKISVNRDQNNSYQLLILYSSEVYLEPCQMSKMDFLSKKLTTTSCKLFLQKISFIDAIERES